MTLGEKATIRKALWLMVSLLLLLAACSDSAQSGVETTENERATTSTTTAGETSTTSTAGTGASEPVQIEFWDFQFAPAEVYGPAGESLVAEFNSQHPDIEVSYRLLPWADWFANMSAAVASGTAPDVSNGGSFMFADFGVEGEILPVTDLVEAWKASGEADDFIEGMLDHFTVDGEYLAIPWQSSVRVWWYRSDVLDELGLEPPGSWDEIRVAAAAATEGSRYGIAIPGGDLNMATQNFTSLLMNAGGGLFDESGALDVVTPENLDAAQFIADLVADGSVHPGSAGFTQPDIESLMAQGDVAFYISHPGLLSVMSESASQIEVLSPPASYNGSRGTIGFINGTVIFEQTEHPDAAKVFLEWWSENQGPLFTEGGLAQIPLRRSIASGVPALSEAPADVIFAEYLPIARGLQARSASAFAGLDAVAGTGALQQAMQQLLQGGDPETVLTALEAELAALVGGG